MLYRMGFFLPISRVYFPCRGKQRLGLLTKSLGLRDGAFRCFVTTRERQSVKTLHIGQLSAKFLLTLLTIFDIR